MCNVGIENSAMINMVRHRWVVVTYEMHLQHRSRHSMHTCHAIACSRLHQIEGAYTGMTQAFVLSNQAICFGICRKSRCHSMKSCTPSEAIWCRCCVLRLMCKHTTMRSVPFLLMGQALAELLRIVCPMQACPCCCQVVCKGKLEGLLAKCTGAHTQDNAASCKWSAVLLQGWTPLQCAFQPRHKWGWRDHFAVEQVRLQPAL